MGVTAGPQGLLPAEPAAGGQPGSVQRPGGKSGWLFAAYRDGGRVPRATEAVAFVPSIPQFRRNSVTVYLFPQTVLESAGFLASNSASAAPPAARWAFV